MQKFAIILPDEVRDYRRFFWTTKWDGDRRFLVKLVGFEIQEIGILPIYHPLLSIKKHSGISQIEIQFTRWASLILQFSKTGVQAKWENLKKNYK